MRLTDIRDTCVGSMYRHGVHGKRSEEETDDKARVDVIIISSKGKLKLKDINAAVTVSEFIETTVIPQLFSKHLMKLKHLRVLVNGKEASDHSRKRLHHIAPGSNL